MSRFAARASAPTLSTVADAAGVSRQTVSNALNNPELLRPDTLARVRRVIDELGYTPNRAARSLRTRSSHLIGVRHEPPQQGTSEALLDRFVHSLVDTAGRTGHHVLLFTGEPGDPLDGYDELLRATAVDAFVVTDTYAGTPQAGFLRERGAPFVTFGRPWEDPDADWAWVDVDGAAGGRMATHHLREAGYQRIAWLGWEATSRIGEDRRSGWQALATERRLMARTSDNVDAARMEAHRLIDAGADAFACVSDTLALGVLHACAERELTPGRDIGVTGFDDSLAAQVVWPGLTSVRQPLEEVAVRLVEQLHRVLAAKPSTDSGVILAPTLVVRGSSRR